jgi:hypothetical protein
MRLILTILTICFALINTTNGLQFTLRQGEETCISKEVLENDAVNGKYSLANQHDTVSVSVRDPMGDLVYMKPGVADGSFAYTSPKTGQYKVCFQNNLTQGIKTVKLTFLSREDTNSQASARKASLQPIEAQIKQIQKMIGTVQREDQWFANQQLAMKERNDNLSFSVMVLNLLLVLVVVVGYFGQMWYLKQYLVSKRVIY